MGTTPTDVSRGAGPGMGPRPPLPFHYSWLPEKQGGRPPTRGRVVHPLYPRPPHVVPPAGEPDPRAAGPRPHPLLTPAAAAPPREARARTAVPHVDGDPRGTTPWVSKTLPRPLCTSPPTRPHTLPPPHLLTACFLAPPRIVEQASIALYSEKIFLR
ncbi:hypothetical protein NDU88_005844 [Pleurodeles waltl]|uniref:Uncharacterized protein n=1 Tax=Pleurodeles waltl TaxID=8319 RepID=A0AAV7WDV4_PLEWA|nr:hypothetical protein NDU88_005844 [Pleurodeles waltl]